jgi:hypothetical protein
MIKLFRAVSAAELSDLINSGKFQAAPNSLEGKFFAETIGDAEQWGQWFYGEVEFHIVAAELPEEDIAKLLLWSQLDGVGPALYAELSDLEHAIISVIR